MKKYALAVFAFFVVLSFVGLAINMERTKSSLDFYYSAFSPKKDFISHKGNTFAYAWWGKQTGKGTWSGYLWEFRETGKVEVVFINESIVIMDIHGNHSTWETDYQKSVLEDYEFFGKIFYYKENDFGYEIYNLRGLTDKSSETRNYRGAWFYCNHHGETKLILNETFRYKGEKVIYVHGTPIRTIVYGRRGSITYVDDGIVFNGSFFENYYFDAETGVLVYYELIMRDMYDYSGTVGWDYEEYYSISKNNFGLSVEIPETLKNLYVIVIILITLYVPIIFLLLAILTMFAYRSYLQRKFYRILRDLKETGISWQPVELREYEPRFYFNGWLRDGWVVFYTSSRSHILYNLATNKSYSLTHNDVKALEELLVFDPLNESERARLEHINSKYQCINFEADSPDKITVDRVLRRELEKYDDSHYFRRYRHFIHEYLETNPELYSFALTIHSFRKIFKDLYSQAYALPIVNTFRALVIKRFVSKKEVLLIGDDDLISLLLARLGFKVYVVDVDRYILKLIAFLARKFDLEGRIHIFKHDIRKPFTLDRKFPAVHVDPSYTIDGLLLFLSRSLQHLETNGYVFLSWCYSIDCRDYLRLAIEHLGLKLIQKFPMDLKYITMIPGVIAHAYTKYGIARSVMPPMLKVKSWSSKFFIMKYTGKAISAIQDSDAVVSVFY